MNISLIKGKSVRETNLDWILSCWNWGKSTCCCTKLKVQIITLIWCIKINWNKIVRYYYSVQSRYLKFKIHLPWAPVLTPHINGTVFWLETEKRFELGNDSCQQSSSFLSVQRVQCAVEATYVHIWTLCYEKWTLRR